MAKFLAKATYKTKGAKGLIKEGGTGRRAAVKQLIEGLGGKVECFYFAYGDTDAIVIVDLPDASAGVAVSLAVNASSSVRLSLTPLLLPEDIDAAVKKLPSYRAPGEEPTAKSAKKK